MPPSKEPSPTPPKPLKLVLGNNLHLNLDYFPELEWLADYLAALEALQTRRDQLTQSIQAIAREREVYRDRWIEPYTKTKGGKSYTYHQLRWLTGERKPSGQPKIKTQHLSHRQLDEARAAIARGQQIEALEGQRQGIEEEIARLKRLVQGRGERLKRAITQNQNG